MKTVRFYFQTAINLQRKCLGTPECKNIENMLIDFIWLNVQAKYLIQTILYHLMSTESPECTHDDVTKWIYLPRHRPFVRGIHWSPVNSPRKGQWSGVLMLSLICAWINGWVNNGEAGDLRHHCAHYGVTVMLLNLYPENPYLYWRPRIVMMPILSSPEAPLIVVMTTCVATNNDTRDIIMATLGF